MFHLLPVTYVRNLYFKRAHGNTILLSDKPLDVELFPPESFENPANLSFSKTFGFYDTTCTYIHERGSYT